MTGSLASPELLLLLPLAFAAGLDLYLTLLVLAGVSLMSPDPVLPPAVADLGRPWIVAVVGTLYLAEAAAEQRPLSDLFWHSAQVLARPVAAALLAVLVLDRHSGLAMVGGGLAAAALAFVVHGVKMGGGLLLDHVVERPPARGLRTLGEDALTGGLLILTLEAPPVAGIVTLTAVLIILVGGPTLRRAHHFALRLAWGAVAHLVSPDRWRGPAELPGWCGKEPISPAGDALESFGLKGTRAGAWGVPGAGGFRHGWVLCSRARPLFAYPQGRGGVGEPLPPDAAPRVTRHLLCTRAELGDGADRVLLLFPRDGPGSEALEAELARERGEARGALLHPRGP